MCLWSRHLWLTPLSDQRPRPAAQDTRCEGRLMVSNVTSHDNIPVISMICKQWELITPSQISPCSLFWPPVSPVSAPQHSEINFFPVWETPQKKVFVSKHIVEILRQNSSSLSRKRWRMINDRKMCGEMKNNSGSDRCGANLMWNVNFINDQVSKSKYYCGDFIPLEDHS